MLYDLLINHNKQTLFMNNMTNVIVFFLYNYYNVMRLTNQSKQTNIFHERNLTKLRTERDTKLQKKLRLSVESFN